MPKTASLYSRFKPATYLVEMTGDLIQLTISGQKVGPPSRRISLHQSGLKIISAKIIRFDKHGPIQIEVAKINHLPTVQQVRLHGGSVMYPGRYQIELEYKAKPEILASLGKSKPSRVQLPSIDEAEAWHSTEVEFKQ